MRALIVEDNRLFREAFRTSLHERIPSIVIEEAGNGEEALQRINGTPPDLIFTDLRLAGMNGLELVKKIKRISPASGLRCLPAMIFRNTGGWPANMGWIAFL